MADRLVYDSDLGPLRSNLKGSKKRPKQRTDKAPPASDGVVRIRRETGGRGGKTVTTVYGVPLPPAQLGALAKELKKHCGVGGAVKDRVIEIQGDHRDRVEAFLQGRGYAVKRAGG